MADQGQTSSIDSPDRRGAQSIHRAVALLREVARLNERGVGVRELADWAGLHTATARRILKALESEALLTYDPVRRLYYLGIELHCLGAAANQFNIRDNFRSALQNLAAQTSETAYLVIRSGNDVLCIDRVEGTSGIRILTVEVGTRAPLGIGSASLAVLASFPEQETEAVIRANRRRYPEYNNRTPADIRALVARTRDQGHAVSEGNMNPDVIAVGLPIRDETGRTMAGIGVMALAGRMNPDRQREMAGLIATEIAAAGMRCDYPVRESGHRPRQDDRKPDGVRTATHSHRGPAS